jgi:hypothetical protein
MVPGSIPRPGNPDSRRLCAAVVLACLARLPVPMFPGIALWPPRMLDVDQPRCYSRFAAEIGSGYISGKSSVP